MMMAVRSGMWGARVCACACVPLAAGLCQEQQQRQNERQQDGKQESVQQSTDEGREAVGVAAALTPGATHVSLTPVQPDIMERVEKATRITQFTRALKRELKVTAHGAVSAVTAATASRMNAILNLLSHVQTANAAEARNLSADKHLNEGADAETDRVYDDTGNGASNEAPLGAGGDNAGNGQDRDSSADTDDDTNIPLHVAYLIQSAHHAVDQQDFKKAATLYDKALAAAEEVPLHDTQLAALATVTGNVHLVLRHFRRAIELFTPAIRVILKQSEYQPDARAIELSLKVASCYHGAGEVTKAESGYRWCIKQARQLKESTPEDQEAQSLHGLVLEEFGMFLSAQKRLRDARDYFLMAADCARELKPEPVTSAATRCYIYASKCSLDLGDVEQASMDLARAQELCSGSDCLFHKEVKEQAKRIQKQRQEHAH